MAALVPDDNGPNVYCTMGHGCETIPDQINGAPVHIETFEVPAGCTFVTLEVVGIMSSDLPKILVAFRDPMWAKALRYPDNDIIREILTEYCDIGKDRPNNISSVIRVRNQGERFTNTHIDLWCPIPGYIFKSGTYQLGNVPTDEIIVQPMTPGELALYNSNSLTPAALTPDRRAQLYRGSIFPTVDQINAGAQTGYRYIDLMTNHIGPGVYYHFACRHPCDMPSYDPQFNFNAHYAQATAAPPGPHFNAAMDQFLAYANQHARKKPVINRMQQLSINRVTRTGRLNQVGLDRALIKRNPGGIYETWAYWNDNYITNFHRKQEWEQRIKVALYGIIPLHPHPIHETTLWSETERKSCDVCGEIMYRTHYCPFDGYNECATCYANRYQPIVPSHNNHRNYAAASSAASAASSSDSFWPRSSAAASSDSFWPRSSAAASMVEPGAARYTNHRGKHAANNHGSSSSLGGQSRPTKRKTHRKKVNRRTRKQTRKRMNKRK